jgi:hypothetical protein
MKGKNEGITSKTYISFVVRMWRDKTDPSAEPRIDWRSEVEHIQSGQRWTFNTLDELLDFLRQWMEDPDALGPAAGE